ncbi:MAG TPA: FAD-dependent monooxygenase, partial [Caulobacteraceae bacterium]|nr:FAD-dependent monooxygenase [Caulobacteraceae bacterium]
KVEDVAFEPARATATLSDGRVLTAPLVVGAEGRGSVVRALAGVGVVGWRYPQAGVVATVALERPHEGVAYEHFLPAGPFAILPLTGKRASLVWTEKTAAAEALRTARPEMLHSLLRRRFGDFLGEVEVVSPVFVYPLALQLAERLAAPRAVFVGDSAHGIHPIAGQGLNLGLKDVAVLAEVLVDARRLGEDIGAEAVLERYAAWRRFDNVTLAAATDLFNRLFSNDVAPLRLMRGLGMAVVNRVGPARRFFMEEAGGAVGDLPRLFKGEAL